MPRHEFIIYRIISSDEIILFKTRIVCFRRNWPQFQIDFYIFSFVRCHSTVSYTLNISTQDGCETLDERADLRWNSGVPPLATISVRSTDGGRHDERRESIRTTPPALWGYKAIYIYSSVYYHMSTHEFIIYRILIRDETILFENKNVMFPSTLSNNINRFYIILFV